MFYSQFILAKKGPLGTIWIAAHLERKLRKNQVADTDIGVSVDSILFPDAPIALRLSSHLLLGVVRIYSRKVNYLFDDCSEALLKVKQAFRSATVDLPPEQSTAPYHSITLPETFDLDDFELPDNEIFQGNYVDHHVSTKEQITLQDTMDGVVYATSQFGLDERFGDGETSQINLELEEEMFQAKDVNTGIEGESGDEQEAFSDAIAAARKDETDIEAAEAMVVDGSDDQVVNLAANTEFDEYAQAPQTPLLVEAQNLSRAGDELACDDHMEVDYNASYSVAEEPKNASSELDSNEQGKSTKDCSSEDKLNHDASVNIQPFGTCEVLPVSAVAGDNSQIDGKFDTETEHGAAEHARAESPCSSHITNELEAFGPASNGQKDHSNNNMIDNSIAEAPEVVPSVDSPGRTTVVDADNPNSLEPKYPEAPTEMQGDQCQATDSRKSEEQADNLLGSDNHSENPTVSIGSDMPAPEKLLSVPEGLTEIGNEFMIESTPDKEVLEGSKGDEGTEKVSGKKRTFTESTLTAESFNSVESVGLIGSRKTAGSVPDDDDLLSSILVGRSSFLKMRPTPVLEVASSKRPRSAPRSTTYKRKVLMDDFMVLNGEIIRKQLTSTEDIRRVRKKAPCALPEILMIHRQFLEDELFKEPIVTGLSVELVTLHSEPYDLKDIKILESDRADVSVKDGECSEQMTCSIDGQELPANITIQQNEDHHDLGFSEEIPVNDQAQPSQTELPSEKSEIETDKDDTGLIDAVNCSSENEKNHELLPEEKNDVAEDVQADGSVTDKGDTGLIDVVNCSSENEKNHEMLPEERNDGVDDVQADGSVFDISNRSATDPIEVMVGDNVSTEMDLKAEDQLLTDENKIDTLVEIKEAEAEADPSAPCDNKDDSLPGASVEIVGEANNDVQIAGLETENNYQDCNGGSNEEDKIVSTTCPEPDSIENPTAEDFDPQIGLDAGTISQDGFVGGFQEELENMAVEHDTEFLNVDDDDVAVDDVDEGDETHVLENSGWSSRTRAVSKYLQTMFENGAENGKNVLSVDSLLVGKTRKEASRMFFETLVLKTKDYIQVEQATPYESINVKPRSKLMKSIF